MKETGKYIYFPILIDLRRFPCLVVGGGKVALRKTQSLLEFNAKVTVISPKICDELKGLSTQGKIRVIRKPYSREFLKGHKIVFSATDNPETNQLVSRDCRCKGILLNVADGPSWCDFILPANLKRGDLIVSVSSQGKAPFFAKETQRKLADFLPPSAADIVELAGEFRRRLLSNANSGSRSVKDKAYRKFLSTDWEQLLATKGRKNSYRYLEEILREAEKAQDI
ncbi:MAG TPA: bifunctional precorrin-2 dehydrogenase/sirohydrochlorin ferrochelatase [Candidatus Kryptobacter bacterium]|nr:bifunctional precorrin-2 dehydrogenase/sirohydrochlorin ferrochelatase [Candidatus Kryptobacter bacterium]